MEKYKPMPMTSPAMQMPMGPAPMTAPMSYPMGPVNVHASYEEINIYEPKKHHHHGHCKVGGWTSVGTILVLYILLVIILRSACK